MKPVQSEEMQSKFWPKGNWFKTADGMENALDKITQGVGQQMQNKALVIIYDKEGFSISNGHKEFSRSENINCVTLLRGIADKMEEARKERDGSIVVNEYLEKEVCGTLNNPSISLSERLTRIGNLLKNYRVDETNNLDYER